MTLFSQLSASPPAPYDSDQASFRSSCGLGPVTLILIRFALPVIKHHDLGLRQLIEVRVYLGLWFQRDKSSS